ncbi:MAG: DUF805 domain-containing protein [Gammaproteobacteria bacterium]|nr:DUF805 domain-containing protein [Gammaproteobacteria bacterium]
MATNPYATPQAELDSGLAEVTPVSWFSHHGRLGVLSYWGMAAVLTLAFLVIGGILGFVAMQVTGWSPSSAESPPALMWLILAPLLLIMIYVGICLAIKRLHDLNMVGWWVLLTLVPIVGMIFSIYLYFWPGKKTPNRFGGWRAAKGWEKVLGIIFMLLMVAGIALSFVAPMVMLGMGGGV